jgi:hypothetical protein
MDKICNIEVNCTKSKGEYVVITNVNVIHFCNSKIVTTRCKN